MSRRRLPVVLVRRDLREQLRRGTGMIVMVLAGVRKSSGDATAATPRVRRADTSVEDA